MRPRVLVLDPDTSSRLALVSSLRALFQVLPQDSSQPALRRVRTDQPALVLVVLGPRRDPRALRTCRVIKTDARAPLLGVVDPWGRADADALLEIEADGLWRGATDDHVGAWAMEILQGLCPKWERPLRRSFLRRLFRR